MFGAGSAAPAGAVGVDCAKYKSATECSDPNAIVLLSIDPLCLLIGGLTRSLGVGGDRCFPSTVSVINMSLLDGLKNEEMALELSVCPEHEFLSMVEGAAVVFIDTSSGLKDSPIGFEDLNQLSAEDSSKFGRPIRASL
ncbi:hypothetical protein CPC16_006238 [Podila verticillata]|nr:hypothetical protein CPC16_006238 [Podila verticillata]